MLFEADARPERPRAGRRTETDTDETDTDETDTDETDTDETDTDETDTDETDTDETESDRPMTRPESAGTTAPYRVAVVGGDGIGPEVVAEAVKVVAASGVSLATTEYDLGAARFLRTGDVLPDAVLDELRSYDAILLGAVGPPLGDTTVPSGLLERGLLLRLRFALDLYVNLRPFKAVPGSIAVRHGKSARDPGEVRPDDVAASARGAGRSVTDLVVVRENTEGPYAGDGGFLRKGTPHEVATQGSVNTRMGAERCVRFAFDLAGRRPPGSRQLTLVHKTNVLEFAGDLWRRTVEDVAAEHPTISWNYHHVDAACIHLVEHPEQYDVIVTDNLFGDILTDLAGTVFGGIGYAASANLNPARTGPSVFEPVHGAAHDIAGKGLANPIGAVSSAVLMLEHLGEVAAADRIAKAVEDFLEESAREGTAGTTASRTTAAIGDAIAERL